MSVVSSWKLLTSTTCTVSACDFSTWNRPVAETCPSCGWVGMEKKFSKTEGESRTCLKCHHKIVVMDAEEAAAT